MGQQNPVGRRRALGQRAGVPWAPYSFESRFQLAWVLVTEGRWDEALDILAIAAPGAPVTPYAALDALRLSILQGRGEPVPTRIHRAQWETDGLVAAYCVGTEIRAAASVSTVMVNDAESAEVLPSVSLARATKVWSPSTSALVGVQLQVPLLSTVAVQTSVEPSYTETLEPASPVPPNVGDAVVTVAPASGEVNAGTVGGVVSMVKLTTLETATFDAGSCAAAETK